MLREHSRLELGRKLRARGFGEGVVDRVLDDLNERALLSEGRMAEVYVAERLRKGFGPLRVRRELRDRGIPDALIEPYLDKTPDYWLELMAVVHNKKFGTEGATDSKELARRSRFLEYRGFPSELIGRFLRGDDIF